jgi:translation initiation factor 5A precursor (eIF-5A)
MAKQQTEVRELDEGSYVNIDDVPCQINSYSTAKPGKHGSAKARIEAEGVFDGQKRRCPSRSTRRSGCPSSSASRAR